MEEMRHVAYLIPHTDVTAEMDCYTQLSGHVIHVQRMWLDEVTEEAEKRMVASELPLALRYLKDVVPYRCAVFGCTSASAVNGRDGMFEIERRIQSVLGCPATTVLGAVLREIRRRQAKSVAMLTPYTDEVNAFMKQTMEMFDVNVCFIAGMGVTCDTEIAALKPEEILSFAGTQKDRIPEEADLCFFSCTNVRSAEIREELSQLVGRPFITSNQCVIDYIKSMP